MFKKRRNKIKKDIIAKIVLNNDNEEKEDNIITSLSLTSKKIMK